MESKREEALRLSEFLLEDFELEKSSVASCLLKTMRIARLLNDVEAIEWLQLEIDGYPKQNNGHISKLSFNIAWKHGRGYYKEETKYVFTETVSELERMIETNYSAINNFTTSGASTSGDKIL